MQFAGDANPLLQDLLAGAFGLGGSRPLGLLGQPGQAERYDASPSTMPNGRGALPAAMTIVLARAAAASTGNGQRRRAAIRPHTTNARRRRWPRSCGYGPADTASVISAAHLAGGDRDRGLVGCAFFAFTEDDVGLAVEGLAWLEAYDFFLGGSRSVT